MLTKIPTKTGRTTAAVHGTRAFLGLGRFLLRYGQRRPPTASGPTHWGTLNHLVQVRILVRQTPLGPMGLLLCRLFAEPSWTRLDPHGVMVAVMVKTMVESERIVGRAFRHLPRRGRPRLPPTSPVALLVFARDGV